MLEQIGLGISETGFAAITEYSDVALSLPLPRRLRPPGSSTSS